ncbi:MAG: ornithine cyclodeaminase family protein [Bacillota bacterium]
MLVLSAEDVRSSITMEEAIHAAEQAYTAWSSREALVPLRTCITVPDAFGVSLFMPGYVRSAGALGAKIVSVFEKNPREGLATIQAVFVLLDPRTGVPLCVMEAASLTALRTGAGTGAAVKVLANPDSSRAIVFGAGVQARTQVEAIATVRPLKEVLVHDISTERLSSFIRDMTPVLRAIRPDIAVEGIRDPEEAVRQCDIITCATTSATPVFSGAWVKQGTHVNAIGSYTPDRRELDETLLSRAAKVVVDSEEATLSEAGDFIIPIGRHIFTASIIYGEIGEILLGKKLGRQSREEITVYKAVGIAALDLAVGKLVYVKAVEKGLGTKVPGF